MKNFVVVFLIVVISGCTSSSMPDGPETMGFQSNSYNNQQDSLFGAISLLSDQEISNILAYQVTLPLENKIAVLKLSENHYWRFYSDDFTQLTGSITDKFINKLGDSNRVNAVSFLPSMLIPQERTVPYLREAAARFQADLLLAYRTRCDSFQKHRIMHPNETKAVCTAEAVLLDIRSGIVPFTAVSSRDYSAVKTKADKNFHETIKKAELEALAICLSQIAGDVASFLERAGTEHS